MVVHSSVFLTESMEGILRIMIIQFLRFDSVLFSAASEEEGGLRMPSGSRGHESHSESFAAAQFERFCGYDDADG
jgi:hypothetical protein